MNKENLLIELGKAIQVDGRVNVDRYCRVVELVGTYLSINYGKPIVSGSLPFTELGEFVDWITEIHFKQYADGWCQAGGSNGWHCTTDELIQMFRDRGNDR